MKSKTNIQKRFLGSRYNQNIEPLTPKDETRNPLDSVVQPASAGFHLPSSIKNLKLSLALRRIPLSISTT